MEAVSAYMHPSQVVMNHIKEPQHASNANQALFDGETPVAALLVDLSKAFERVKHAQSSSMDLQFLYALFGSCLAGRSDIKSKGY